MPRTVPFLLSIVLLALAFPGAAAARYDVRVGIGDQSAALFDDSAFGRAKVKRVRYFIPWNAIEHPAVRLAARTYVRRARSAGISVLMHISTEDLRVGHGALPTPSQYRHTVGRLVRYLRKEGVREWGVWNEANHRSQPTSRSPRRAAQYFREMRRICHGCRILALDVLDQRGVESYIKRFYAELSDYHDRQARFIGIHNYSDVNRRRSTGTRAIMSRVRRYTHAPRFWLTETGGLVGFGRSFPCNETRAAHRTSYLFGLVRRYRRSIQRVYVYNWFGTDCRSRFDAGLVDRDGATRPAYATFRRELAHFKR
jgi:hypothetical protein